MNSKGSSTAATVPKKRRPKGDGSVQKLPNGKYKIQITIGYDGKGKQRKKSFTGKTQTEAIAMKNEYLKQHQEGTLVTRSVYTFAEYARRFLSQKEPPYLRHTTYQGYKDVIELHLIPYMGTLKIQKVTTAVLNDYFKKKRETLAVTTVGYHKGVLNALFEVAINEKVVGKNPVKGTNPLRETPTGDSEDTEKFQTLTQEQITKVLKFAREIFEEPGNQFRLMYHIILLALASGCRRGELLGLTWDRVNFEDSTITIRRNVTESKMGSFAGPVKTPRSKRTIKIAADVMEKLKEIKVEGSEYVFTTRTGHFITPSTIGLHWRTIREELGLEEVRFHDLRHTHATQLLSRGVSLKDVSKRLGHSSVKTTLTIYAHCLPEADVDAAEIAGSLLA